MTQADESSGRTCRAGCPTCPGTGGNDESHAGLCGWRLAAAAAAVFLVPPALAIAGSLVAGPTTAARSAGAAVGLAVGAAAAVLVARLTRRTGKEAP